MRSRVFVLLFALVSLAACQKELSEENGQLPTNPPPGTGTLANFRATINGQPWEASLRSATRGNRIITLSGTSAALQTLAITLGDSGIHTYRLTPNSSNNFALFTDAALSNPAPFVTNPLVLTNPALPILGNAGGTVSITAIDTVNRWVTGTFSFNALRASDGQSRTVTSGVFTQLPYSVTGGGGGVPPPANNDTLYGDVNGTRFTPGNIIATSLPGSGSIVINGSDISTGRSFTITVPDTITPGTYLMNASGILVAYSSSITQLYTATLGTLNISSHNTTTKRIRGTFNFTGTLLTGGTGTVLVTNGFMAVSY